MLDHLGTSLSSETVAIFWKNSMWYVKSSNVSRRQMTISCSNTLPLVSCIARGVDAAMRFSALQAAFDTPESSSLELNEL